MTQEQFAMLPTAIKDWIASLGWSIEDIDSFDASRGIVPAADVVDERGHPIRAEYAASPLMEFTVCKAGDVRTETFNDSSGEWKKVEGMR